MGIVISFFLYVALNSVYFTNALPIDFHFHNQSKWQSMSISRAYIPNLVALPQRALKTARESHWTG
jgi:hypothetical protein